MSKCRYDLSEDCNSNDCLICVLNKIRAEIKEEYGYCNICEYFEDYDYEENDISEYRYVASVKDILQIIDKYKLESEGKE